MRGLKANTSGRAVDSGSELPPAGLRNVPLGFRVLS